MNAPQLLLRSSFAVPTEHGDNRSSRLRAQVYVLDVLLEQNNVSGASKLEKALVSHQKKDELPTFDDLFHMVKECRKKRSSPSAQLVLSHIHSNGLEVHTELGNNLVPMLVECGDISDALKIFNRLIQRNVYSWTSLIQGYTECGEFHLALDLHGKMQEDAVDPNGFTFLALLKCCARLRCEKTGRRIHADIAKDGFDLDPFVGNATVDMYAKCGLLLEAREVFDELLVQDIVSWNALLAGFLEQGLEEEVLSCLKQLNLEELSLDAVTFVYGLKACGSLAAIDSGRLLHTDIIKEGLEGDTFIGNILVDMYAKCNLLEEAREVFNELSARDVVSWTALIAGYAEHGYGEEALTCLEKMQQSGVPSNAFTLACSLKACGIIQAIDQGRKLHVYIVKEGFEKDSVICDALLNMYAKCVSFEEAREVFNELIVCDVATWNALITVYTENGLGEEGMSCFEQMKGKGVACNAITYVSVLKACLILGIIDAGREIHIEIVKGGFEQDVAIRNTLVDMYAKSGHLVEAQELFDKLTARDVVAWTALISAYAEHGQGEDVLNCLEQMQEEEFSANDVTFVSSLKACGNIGAIDRSREIHAEIVKEEFERDSFVGNTLVDVYAKCGLLIEAQEIFDTLPVRTVVSWNVLMAGRIHCGFYEEALRCFEQMQLDGLCPDAATFVLSLTACGSIRATKCGWELHSHIVKDELENDVRISNSLIDMYAKCGALADARKVFDDLPVVDEVAWTTLISGYSEHRQGEEVLSCLESLLASGMLCDATTHLCCLKACGSIAATDMGQKLHARVIIERFDKYLSVGNMLINMYGKCGLLVEAREVFDELLERDVVTWTALISGYAEAGYNDLALGLFEEMQLEGVSPNAVTYVFSLKACGALGSVSMGLGIHADIVNQELEKDPIVGNSLVDMYANLGMFEVAHAVIGELAVRDVVSWNVLIAGYSEHQHLGDVEKCLACMQLEGVAPDTWTFACTLPVYASEGAIANIQGMHIEILKKGFENDFLTCSALVDSYAKCGALAEAQEIFNNLPSQDITSWTALLSGYIRYEISQERLTWLLQMQPDGMDFDPAVLVCSLKACGSIGAIEWGQKMHSDIVKVGLEGDIYVGHALIDLYGKCKLLADLEKSFTDLLVHDVVSWNILVAGYSELGLVEVARECLVDMKLDGTAPDVITWNAIISGYADEEENEKVMTVYAQMQEHSLLPNQVTFLSMLKICGKLGLLVSGKRIHALACNYNELETTDVSITTALIDMYFKCGSMFYAQQVFDVMPSKNLVKWNALLAGYARQGESEFIFVLLERMRQEGIRPDEITLLCVLTACSHVGLIEKGFEFLDVMSKQSKVTLSTNHYNCMVDLLARAGQFDETVLMLERMPRQPDLITWSTLFGACQKWGNVQLAKKAFKGLLKMDEKDDSLFTLMGNIYADSQVG